MMVPTSVRLDRAVRALCPLIEENLAKRARLRSEGKLRRELVACALGTQVTYEMATKAMYRLEVAGLLAGRWWSSTAARGFEKRVRDVLAGRVDGVFSGSKYRFWKTKSRQIAKMRDQLADKPMMLRLRGSQSAKELRREIVEEMPGIGPKQASMFLRNVGITFDLAILDIHVLRFLAAQGLLRPEDAKVGSIGGYERVEVTACGYAGQLGYPVGYIDWAVWATMKAARQLKI